MNFLSHLTWCGFNGLFYWACEITHSKFATSAKFLVYTKLVTVRVLFIKLNTLSTIIKGIFSAFCNMAAEVNCLQYSAL